jgi:two-component system phosphate regulon sensor histidine kinase PhoR
MENHNARPEVREAREGRVGSSVRFSHTINQDAVYVAQLLDARRPDGLVVRLSYPKRAWQRFATPGWAVVAAAALCALLVMAWLAWLLQRQWVAPVQSLWTAAARLAAGEWHTRVEPRGADELRFFSERLNVVAQQAQQQLAELDAQRADLRALVDSLPDPILLTDASRRVVMINAPAARLLGVTALQAQRKLVTEVVSDEAVLVLLESLAPEPGQTQQREIRLTRGGQRLTFHAVATRTKVSGCLLVLRNISALASAGQMKTDFVANASHELRTPIAAIKIAFETLQDVYTDDPRQAARCIAVIDGHVRRLEEMLGDLLDLSRVESAEIRPNLANVTARELLQTVRTTMGPVARQKGVELILADGDGASDALHFESDKRLLDLILRNLVENSVKYTPAGGRVSVTVTEAEPPDAHTMRRGAVVFEVRDTGIGIAPEHLDRVFERFYQVDPARSGSAGRGTGLGLAIVKHAINALDGEVTIESKVGAGTTIRCVIPVSERVVVEAIGSHRRIPAPGTPAAG